MSCRLRILAGPNGSGKTSVFGELREKFHWGVFVNADEIERRLKEECSLDFREYAVAAVDEEKFRELYYVRSLQHLYAAVKQSDRAYFFDNSGKHFELLAEYDAADKSVQLYSETEWLKKYLLNMAETTSE